MNATDSRATVAKDLSAIENLHAKLLTQAVHKANDRTMPGGAAMVSLAGVANLEAWEYRYEAAEAWGLNTAHIDDEDDTWEPVLQTLCFWSGQWRARREAEYDQRPTVVSEANFIRWSLDWAWDNEPEWDAFRKDIAKARANLEGILVAGVRAERGVPCMYDECRGVRLVRKMVPGRDDDTGAKVWKQTDWHCPTCRRAWDEDRYAAMVVAASERVKFEEIDGETWCSVDYAAKKVGRSVKTIRTWVARGELETTCILTGRRNFVRLNEVRERSEAPRTRKVAG